MRERSTPEGRDVCPNCLSDDLTPLDVPAERYGAGTEHEIVLYTEGVVCECGEWTPEEELLELVEVAS